jgi:beta-lactamase regulating signal transducer with metallopeptidase domain
MMSFAQLAVGRVVNSLPEGLLIALGAWLLLRLMGRQNSGTRFAVWMVALAGVVALPFLGGFGVTPHSLTAILPHAHPEVAISASWAVAFFVLWIAIAVLALARVAAGIWQVRRIRRSCTEIMSADIDPALRELLAEAKRPIRLLSSETARVPAALGFRSPAILLPAWAFHDLSTEELRPIIIHELAHLRRHDDWTNLLQKAIRAVLFFHPAVWWIDARLSLEREMACDDAVLATTGNARAYAGCLIDLLERGCARRGLTMAQAAVARARDASIRIARILRVGSSATTRVGRGALAIAASLAVACAGFALVTPQLVEFVPMESASAAQLSVPSLAEAVHTPASAVIPAAFHPDPNPARSSAPLHDALLRSPAPHIKPFRQNAARTSHPARNPYVLAKLINHPADSARPQPIPAGFTVADAADSSASTPLVVIFETRESTNTLPTQAALQTVAAQPAGMKTNSPANNKVRQLRSKDNPALQVQMYDAVDPATGTPVRILRIVFTIPQTGMSSQSI